MTNVLIVGGIGHPERVRLVEGDVMDAKVLRAAQVIESSDLDYTVVRPAWLINKDEIAYGTTQKSEPFASPGAVVTRKSVADLVVKLALTPGVAVRNSLGVHKQ